MPRTQKQKPEVRERKLGRHGAVGLCWEDGLIEIDSDLKGIERIDTICHELWHHYEPELSETEVNRRGAQFAKVLWQMGYRRVDLG